MVSNRDPEDGSRPPASGPSYSLRLFMLMLVFTWTLAACFMAFQYQREHQYAASRLDYRLQGVNLRIASDVAQGLALDSAVQLAADALPGLRVTVIDKKGDAIWDNADGTVRRGDPHLGDHNARSEVLRARAQGSAYTIERLSSVDSTEYFYSATALPDGSGTVVRSALPYTASSLRSMLATDGNFLWIMLAISLFVSFGAWLATYRIGRTVTRLNLFAAKARSGQTVTEADTAAFGTDELGSISGHIVRLYADLQRAVATAEAQHRQALHQEREKTRIKKQLTNNINHELKTPVASMRACLETLVDNPDLDADRRQDFTARALEAAERLSDMLADVATLTRMDDGAQAIDLTSDINLRQLVDHAVTEAMTSHPDAAKGWTVDNQLSDRLAVTGNPGLMVSLFRNLVDNALSHSGGSHLVIACGTSPDADHVLITVTDDGTGVAPEHLPHLFERFYRVDAGRARSAGGTGLGLAIVRNAVAVHSGTIRVTAAVPHGLRFTFTLKK